MWRNCAISNNIPFKCKMSEIMITTDKQRRILLETWRFIHANTISMSCGHVNFFTLYNFRPYTMPIWYFKCNSYVKAQLRPVSKILVGELKLDFFQQVISFDDFCLPNVTFKSVPYNFHENQTHQKEMNMRQNHCLSLSKNLQRIWIVSHAAIFLGYHDDIARTSHNSPW